MWNETLDQQIMLRVLYIISRKIDILQGNTNLKLLQLVLLSIIMAILTESFYKITSGIFLFVSLCLVIYILVSEFMRVKSMHEDLKIACNLPE